MPLSSRKISLLLVYAYIFRLVRCTRIRVKKNGYFSVRQQGRSGFVGRLPVPEKFRIPKLAKCKEHGRTSSQ